MLLNTASQSYFDRRYSYNNLQATKNLSNKTLKTYSSDLNQFFKHEQNILHPDICAFISYLNIELKLKDTSIRRKIITLKNFYNYLIDSEVIESSPFKKLKFKFKQERKSPKTLSITEIGKILKCFDIEISTLYASVATTQIYTEVTTARKKQVLKKFNYRNKL